MTADRRRRFVQHAPHYSFNSVKQPLTEGPCHRKLSESHWARSCFYPWACRTKLEVARESPCNVSSRMSTMSRLNAAASKHLAARVEVRQTPVSEQSIDKHDKRDTAMGLYKQACFEPHHEKGVQLVETQELLVVEPMGARTRDTRAFVPKSTYIYMSVGGTSVSWQWSIKGC